MLSLFDLCGPVGEVLANMQFGLFGILAYLFPLGTLLASAFLISNIGNKNVRNKVIYSIALYIILAALIQWVIDTPVKSPTEYFKISMIDHAGGGLLGGSISFGLTSLLGKVGAFCVLFALFIISFILLTGKMIVSSLSSRVKDGYKTQSQRRASTSEPKQRRLVKMEPVKEDKPARVVPAPKEKLTRDEKKQALAKAKEEKAKSLQEMKIIRHEPEDIPIYEEELSQKFGNESDSQDTVEAKPRRQSKPRINKAESEQSVQMIEEEKKEPKIQGTYQYPSLDLLTKPKRTGNGVSDKDIMNTAEKLQETLRSFGVDVSIGDVSLGPTITRYELIPAQGVKVSKITSLTDDIKLSLAVSEIRMEAPIPGKSAVGIEVPNKEKNMVTLRELLESSEFQAAKSRLSFAVGKNISGKTIVTDVSKMPHLLVAGTTGSGKSVCINTFIMSILFKARPDEVRLILIDPKMVEFKVYNDIPHLMIPVVTDPKKAAGALNWAVAEMTKRYQLFSEAGVRNIEGYNRRMEKMSSEHETYEKMPKLVIIVDEFADLMMVAPGEVEDAVCRLAQLARAAGIHLVLATQRPSVNVITGLIKANIPSRIALSVSSAIDSRTMIDSSGAEKLLGNGDMLFAPGDIPKPIRIQGGYVSDKEVSAVVDFLKKQFGEPVYDEKVTEHIETSRTTDTGSVQESLDEKDVLFTQAAQLIIDKDKASIGMLQRAFRIGFNRAARIMDQLCDAGVVGPEEGTKPRNVLMTEEQFSQYCETEE